MSAPNTGKKRKLNPPSVWDEEVFLDFLKENNINTKHAWSLWRFIIQNPNSDIRECPGLPKRMYDLVEKNFAKFTSHVKKVNRSSDNKTTKLLIELQDGGEIETVIMRYNGKNLQSHPRNTVCVSSQVGCAMGCKFCATGTMGLSSHLTCGEIIEQLLHASQIEPIRNVVFMGMGEPLDNYTSVISAIRAMIDHKRFHIASHHICVSTVGLINRMKQLRKDAPGVELALSLHAPNQELRAKIVPSAKAYPIDKLMAVVDEYLQNKQRVMMEYIVIGNLNDGEDVAHELGKLLQGKNVVVNLIPYNPTNVAENYIPPTNESLMQFEKILRQDYKLFTTIRRTMGQDIAGACGQLVVNSKACDDKGVKDIEDLVSPKEKKNSFTYQTWVHTVSTDNIVSQKRIARKKKVNEFPRSFITATVVMITSFGILSFFHSK